MRQERARSIITSPSFVLHPVRIKRINGQNKNTNEIMEKPTQLPSIYPSFDRYAFITTWAQIQRSIDGRNSIL
jgi:hypothetical protein